MRTFVCWREGRHFNYPMLVLWLKCCEMPWTNIIHFLHSFKSCMWHYGFHFQCMNSQCVIFIQSRITAYVMNVEMTFCNMSPSPLSMQFLLRSEVQQSHLCQTPVLVEIVIRHLTILYSFRCVLWLLSLCAHIWISGMCLKVKTILRLLYV